MLSEPLGLRHCYLQGYMWSSQQVYEASLLKVNSIVGGYHKVLIFFFFQKMCLMGLT